MKSGLSLLLLSASFAAGQSSYVSNTIGTNYSAINTLAPAMLATLQPNSIRNGYSSFAKLSAFILPASAMMPIPVINTFGTNFIVPAGVPFGSAELYWSIDGAPYQFIDVNVVPVNFELASISNLSTPARPGETISLDGSGLGYGTQVSASIGGMPAAIIYAGRGTPAGHDLVRVQIPVNAQTGCYVPLTLTYGPSSLTTSISITNDGLPCSHPFQLSTSDLKALDAGLSIATLQISLSTILDGTTASAVHRDETALVFSQLASAGQLSDLLGRTTPAGCRVAAAPYLSAGIYGGMTIYYPLALPPSPGSQLVLRGPAGGNYYPNLPPTSEGTLKDPPAPDLASGKWTLITPGSDDLSPTEFDFTLPQPFQIDGSVPLSFSRTVDQTVTWNRSILNSAATVSLSLSGRSQDGRTPFRIVCTGPANQGSLTIPSSLLASFAANSIGSLGVQVSPNGLIPQHMTVQTKSGSTYVIYLSYSSGDDRPVDFQ